MTAPRMCRRCGADLPGNVMWCLRCYEPVRHLTPREPQLPTVQLIPARPARSESRWKAGVSTFGPVGRVAITACVFLFFPWGTLRVSIDPVSVLTWYYLLGYLPLAFLILRSVWRKDLTHEQRWIQASGADGAPVDHGPPVTHGLPRPAPPEQDPEPVRVPIPRSTAVAFEVLALLGLSLAVAWTITGSVGHGMIGMCMSLAALVVGVVWLVKP